MLVLGQQHPLLDTGELRKAYHFLEFDKVASNAKFRRWKWWTPRFRPSRGYNFTPPSFEKSAAVWQCKEQCADVDRRSYSLCHVETAAMWMIVLICDFTDLAQDGRHWRHYCDFL